MDHVQKSHNEINDLARLGCSATWNYLKYVRSTTDVKIEVLAQRSRLVVGVDILAPPIEELMEAMTERLELFDT